METTSSESDFVAIPSIPSLPASVFRTSIVLALALGSGLFVARWMDSTGEATLTGLFRVESVCIPATRSGIIDEVLVPTGQPIEAGDAVVKLADSGLDRRREAKRLEVEALNAELAQAQARAQVELTWRTKELDQEVFETKTQMASHLKERFSSQIAREAWTDYLVGEDALTSIGGPDSVFKSLIGSRSFVHDETWIRALLKQEAASNAAEVHTAQAEMCEQHLQKLETLKSGLPDIVRQAAGVDVVQARLAIAMSQLEQLDAIRKTLTLYAPTYGTVGGFYKNQGDRIEEGETVVAIQDNDRPYLTVPVPARLLSQFTPGTDVELTFPSDDARTGRVVAQTCLNANVTPAGEDSVTMIRVEPTGKLWPMVPIGSAVNVVVPND